MEYWDFSVRVCRDAIGLGIVFHFKDSRLVNHVQLRLVVLCINIYWPKRMKREDVVCQGQKAKT